MRASAGKPEKDEALMTIQARQALRVRQEADVDAIVQIAAQQGRIGRRAAYARSLEPPQRFAGIKDGGGLLVVAQIDDHALQAAQEKFVVLNQALPQGNAPLARCARGTRSHG